MPKCTRMKNINRCSFFLRLTLGIFLGMVFFSGGSVGAEDVEKCSAFTTSKAQCERNLDCIWSDSLLMKCRVRSSACRAVNSITTDDDDIQKKIDFCTAKECWWNMNSRNPKKGVCRPVPGTCTGRRWIACTGDCRWLDGECMLRAAKQDQKAVEAIEGICNEKPVDSKRNDFFIKTLPDPCIRPVTNAGVQNFCDQHAEDLTPYGKRKCRSALGHVLASKQQECLDDSEMRYQRSLKDSGAREQRRADDAACRAGVAEVYSGPVFGGGGLRSGAILAHENLTKSISHETDLKALILGWTKFVLELVAILAVLAVVWAGILYITDMGDGGNQEKAKKILIWVAVGILVILGSYAIVNALMKADLGSSRAEIITSLDA